MNLPEQIFAEAFGTFMLIFTIGIAEGDPFAVGGIILSVMIITQFISGALLNPAVTFTVGLKRHFTGVLTRKDLQSYFYYTLVQFLFGFLGAFLAWKIGHFTKFYDYSSSYPVYKALTAEALYTSILCINALTVGSMKRGLYLECLIIVITVITGSKTIGHLTQCCLNPVVGLSFNLVEWWAHGEHLQNTWVYILGPMLGGLLGAVVSQLYALLTPEAEPMRSSLLFDRELETFYYLKHD
jgi:glycerol uptake facilitator-like aquaporin